jgi:hypothetical protein
MYHGVPPLPSGYNNTYQIFQTPGLVAILDENIHHVRMVPLDGRPHIPENVRNWNGDSRGHWEGTTLVVDTTNFNEKTRLRYGGSEHTHAVVIQFQFVMLRIGSQGVFASEDFGRHDVGRESQLRE